MNADLIDAEAALAEYDEYAAAQGGADWGDRLLRSGAAHERGVDALETATRQARIATAEQYALCGELLADARAFPDPWCGPDPTTDPDWVDPRERTAAQVRASRVEFAERAAVADLAVRIRVSERTVRAWADTARTLQERCPVTWRAFRAGRVDERNADTAASLAGSLPADDRQAWERFDQAAADAASRLPAGKFRTHARALRERVHPEGIDARHRRAARDRATWLSPELDGMATYSIYGPAARLLSLNARVDRLARHLHAQPGETRTLAQLRADVATGLLQDGITDDTVGVTVSAPSVAITVPVMTLLGHAEEPAILDGYGPIDLETAKNLAGGATSWVRILTHPISGTILDVDRSTYRVPAALRRWLNIRDKVCTFPGCGRLARDCDIDHKAEWQHGGATSADNTGPLCESHHQVKTETLWRPHTDPETGTTWWISPTAHATDADPPPW